MVQEGVQHPLAGSGVQVTVQCGPVTASLSHWELASVHRIGLRNYTAMNGIKQVFCSQGGAATRIHPEGGKLAHDS